MIIKEGTQLTITHVRSGTWEAIAIKDFDTETEIFWPVILDEGQFVRGISGYGPYRVAWQEADPIPCRLNLVKSYEITGNIYESPEVDK